MLLKKLSPARQNRSTVQNLQPCIGFPLSLGTPPRQPMREPHYLGNPSPPPPIHDNIPDDSNIGPFSAKNKPFSHRPLPPPGRQNRSALHRRAPWDAFPGPIHGGGLLPEGKIPAQPQLAANHWSQTTTTLLQCPRHRGELWTFLLNQMKNENGRARIQ
jgi:hypothetical protein